MIVTPVFMSIGGHLTEGRHCVGPNVQVGDLVQTKNGNIRRVVEVDGSSIFCRNPELPTKAILEKEK